MQRRWLAVLVVFTAIFAMGLAQPPDPAKLVEQLGSSKYSERESAAAELEKLGPKALAALRDATGAKDQEVRVRAAAILGKIESGLLDKPTLVELDYREVSIADFVKSFNSRGFVQLTLTSDQLPDWRTTKITLSEQEPVPLLKALDLFCEAAHVRLFPFTGPVSGRPHSRFQVIKDPVGSFPVPPVCYSGPFRIAVSSVHHHRDLTLAQRDGRNLVQHSGDRFYVQMALSAEARLNLGVSGEVKVDEATDDQGRSLLKTTNPGNAGGVPGAFPNNVQFGQVRSNMVMNMNGLNGMNTYAFQVDLNYAENPSAQIKTLKGSIPVAITARRSDPLSIDLADAAGKSFTCEDAQITIHDVQFRGEQQQVAIDLTVKPIDNQPIQQPNMKMHAISFPNYMNSIELQDESGEPFQWYFESNSFNNGVSRMTMVVNSAFNGNAMVQFNPKAGVIPAAAEKDQAKEKPPAEAKPAPAPRGVENEAVATPKPANAEEAIAKPFIIQVQKKDMGPRPGLPIGIPQPVGKKRTVTKLLYHGTIHGSATVPFEFHNLPMP